MKTGLLQATIYDTLERRNIYRNIEQICFQKQIHICICMHFGLLCILVLLPNFPNDEDENSNAYVIKSLLVMGMHLLVR